MNNNYRPDSEVMRKIVPTILVAVLMSVLSISQALASPCRGNGWQPTFVHDLRSGCDPGPYYVLPDGRFYRLQEGNYVNNACQLINQYGLRDRRGYTNCQNYVRVQCGCDESSRGNAACARLLQAHGNCSSSNKILNLVGKWNFGRSMDGGRTTNTHLCNLTLTNQFVPGRGYRIHGCHPNESYWSIEGDELIFRASNGRISTRFKRTGYGNYWEGPFTLDPNRKVRHYLRR